MQVPGHKDILLFKLLLANTLLPLPFLLVCPNVDQPLATHTGHTGELIYSSMTQGLVGEVMDNCDGDKGVTGLWPERQSETISCEQLIILVLFLGCLEQTDGPISAHHEQLPVYTHVLAVAAAHVKHHRPVFQIVQELLNPRPRLVASVGKVWCDLVVDFVDVLLLQLSWEGGLGEWS